jgi:hypothetical protein
MQTICIVFVVQAFKRSLLNDGKIGSFRFLSDAGFSCLGIANGGQYAARRYVKQSIT